MLTKISTMVGGEGVSLKIAKLYFSFIVVLTSSSAYPGDSSNSASLILALAKSFKAKVESRNTFAQIASKTAFCIWLITTVAAIRIARCDWSERIGQNRSWRLENVADKNSFQTLVQDGNRHRRLGEDATC